MTNAIVEWCSIQAYMTGSREQWVKEWPGQVVLCTSQMFWTIEVHDAIREGPGGLKTYWENLNAQLLRLVAHFSTRAHIVLWCNLFPTHLLRKWHIFT